MNAQDRACGGGAGGGVHTYTLLHRNEGGGPIGRLGGYKNKPPPPHVAS